VSPTATRSTGADARVDVRKTYKLYIGGKFPRSESGRSYEVVDGRGRFLANAAQGSRKDARDAVVAARGAFAGWAGTTAYNRGQVLYRVAEVMEGRRAQFVAEVRASEGVAERRAETIVSQAIDRWVWYAGWTDKLAQVLGGLNPVAGPYFDISAPEPTGVVAVLAPQRSSLLGLVSVLAPVVCSGNTAVVLTSERRPLPAITLSEALATSDVPGGVINLITGRTAEVAPWLASPVTSTPSTSRAPPTRRASAGATSSSPPRRTSSASSDPRARGPTRSSPTGRARPTWAGSRRSSRPRRSGTPRVADP
jgi:acyl-CoA reductase-like NAD-dependent aldehyde dehydrogenase